MAAKTKNTKKKKRVDIDELRALRSSYNHTLSFKDFFKYVGGPAILTGGFSLLLLYNFWVTLLFGGIGVLYGLTFFLPKAVRKQYEQEAFNQRNKFLNNITQVLTDDNQTVLTAINKVTSRADGAFREDLQRFHAMLIGANRERVRDAVEWFSSRYESDIIFQQYLEQLETMMNEGKTNIETLKDVKTYHNDIRKKQEQYEKAKQSHMGDMKQIVGAMVILLVALGVSFGFDQYLEAFARHPIGYITSGIYMTVMLFFFRQFSVYLFDDEIMEISK